MSLSALSYRDALSHDDPSEVVAVKAPAGPIDEIVRFENLTSLSLSNNTSIGDFAFLERLPRLEQLFLSEMGLSEIPQEVAKLDKLTTLFLGHNTIKDFTLLERLPALVDLGLEEMGLRKIPDVVLKISGLRILGLYDNSIASLSSLGKLRALEEIYAGGNNLKKIPKELLKLDGLRKLDVSGNYSLEDRSVLFEATQLEELLLTNAHDIEAIGPGLFGLENLRSLTVHIHWNAPADDLGGLEDIGKLAKLEELTIHGASFVRLPDAIGELQSLRSLDLSDNGKLEDIGALKGLSSLETLNLEKCAIRSVPESFSTLESLVSLELSHNKGLRDVAGLRDLPALETLKMYSKLRELPDTMGSLTNLKVLNLSAKAKDVAFLAKLENLEELYLANCQFEVLPNTLGKLKKLTLFRGEEAEDDSYLESYEALESLEVTQPSFTLPKIPSLRSLSVGRISERLDLENLASMPGLVELSVHRSDSIRALPPVIAAAKGLEVMTVEFMKALTDITALQDLGALRELDISHCDTLGKLPAELATLTALERLTLRSLKQMANISVIGELENLTELKLKSLDRIEALPGSLGALTKLESVELRSMKKLKDISALVGVGSLTSLRSEYCDSLGRKAIAEVENAMASGDTDGGLTTSYAAFMESGRYKELTGKEDAKQTYGFPLWFDTPATLLDAMESFSWLDDWRYDEDSEENAILTDADSAMKPLAVLDLGWEGCDTEYLDSYSEEIFLVDTAGAKNPVFIWGHDGSPTKIHDTFDDFLANLRDFVIEGEEDEDSDGDAGDAGNGGGVRTYLEYKDAKSSKFWQVVVDGDQHTVTYGKIGSDGQSKTKDFADAAAAQKDADKLIKSKVKKGYREK